MGDDPINHYNGEEKKIKEKFRNALEENRNSGELNRQN
jgi:hypothetical protein